MALTNPTGPDAFKLWMASRTSQEATTAPDDSAYEMRAARLDEAERSLNRLRFAWDSLRPVYQGIDRPGAGWMDDRIIDSIVQGRSAAFPAEGLNFISVSPTGQEQPHDDPFIEAFQRQGFDPNVFGPLGVRVHGGFVLDAASPVWHPAAIGISETGTDAYIAAASNPTPIAVVISQESIVATLEDKWAAEKAEEARKAAEYAAAREKWEKEYRSVAHSQRNMAGAGWGWRVADNVLSIPHDLAKTFSEGWGVDTPIPLPFTDRKLSLGWGFGSGDGWE